MSSADNLFAEASGLSGPWEVEWEDWQTGELVCRSFSRPAVLVGRNPQGDLVLDHPQVSKRHAYLQVIEGRVYAIDLESRDGLRWGGVPRRSGWFDRGRPMQLGPTALRLGSVAPNLSPRVGASPLSDRFAPQQSLPEVELEVRDAEGVATRLPMDRPLMLVGGSPLCNLRLPDETASRFACALVRTPSGVWLVDLLSSRGVTVNGVACRDAWLDDQDVVAVGKHAIRLTYGGGAAGPQPVRATGWNRSSGESGLPAAIQAAPGFSLASEASGPVWELIPDILLRQLSAPDEPLAEAGAGAGVWNQALLMLVRLLGETHRDHLAVVRTELEQIRQLNQEMTALRTQLAREVPGASPAPGGGRLPRAPRFEPPAAAPEADAPAERLNPLEVQAIAGKRLAAWDRERQNRWRKVMDLLVKP